MGKVRLGQRLLGQMVLRPQRNRLRLTIKRIAQAAGYESYNMVSYIELGSAAITPDKVSAVAKAYQLEEEEFYLLWYLAQGLDDGIPPNLLSILFDNEQLWRLQDPAAGRMGQETREAGSGSDLPTDRGSADLERRSGLRIITRRFIREMRRLGLETGDPVRGEELDQGEAIQMTSVDRRAFG